MHELPPDRLSGQGLDANQFESGDRAILALLHEPPARDQVDLVATFRDGAYEVWSRRGMVRFKRYLDDRGELAFEIVERIGENPVANQDPFAVATIEEELAAAEKSGNPVADPNHAFIEPAALTHPHAYERIAQVFDHVGANDVIEIALHRPQAVVQVGARKLHRRRVRRPRPIDRGHRKSTLRQDFRQVAGRAADIQHRTSFAQLGKLRQEQSVTAVGSRFELVAWFHFRHGRCHRSIITSRFPSA